MRKILDSTFQGNKHNKIYNWFEFTEAYSFDLVKKIFEKYPINKKNILVYDPFCGTGTTLLTSKEFKFNAIGTDVSYLMYLVSSAKTQNYNINLLNNLLPQILILNDSNLAINQNIEWIKKYFYSENLKDLINIKNNIDKINENEKFFFYLVLLKTIEKIMNANKNNSSLTKVKKAKRITSKVFENIFKELVKDIKKTRINSNSEIKVYNKSVFKFLEDNKQKFDYVITSPPYLNKTEYTKRYGLELAILNKDTILKEHLGEINSKINKNKYFYENYFSEKIKNLNTNYYKSENYSLQEYFMQLEDFIKLITKQINKNGIISITIAGGIIGKEIFDIYEYIQELYKLNNLKVMDISINRNILCHYNRTEKIGYIKEFTIIGKK